MATENWKVGVCKDIIKGQWQTGYEALVHFEYFYVMAWSGRDFYVHFCHFMDNYEGARDLCLAISRTKGFSPENKPGLWHKIVDSRPIRRGQRFSIYYN